MPLPRKPIGSTKKVYQELAKNMNTKELFEKCSQRHGTIEIDGESYALAQDAYIDSVVGGAYDGDTYYRAAATDIYGTIVEIEWHYRHQDDDYNAMAPEMEQDDLFNFFEKNGTVVLVP